MDNGSFFESLGRYSMSMELVTALNGSFVLANEAFDHTFGFTQEQLQKQPPILLLTGGAEVKVKTDAKAVAMSAMESNVDIRMIVGRLKQAALAHGFSESVMLSLLSASGKHIDVYLRCSSLRNGEYLLWSSIDVRPLAQRELALENSLKQSQEYISMLAEQEVKLNFALGCAMSLCWEMTPDLKTLVFNPTFEQIMGVNQADYDYDFMTFISTYLSPFKDDIVRMMNDLVAGKTDMFEKEISMYDSNGKLHWLMVRGKFIDEKRELIYGVSINITEQKEYEERLYNLAYRDALTGLYKTEYVREAFENRIPSLKMSNIGLLLIDVIRFRDFSAAYGYERADDILVSIAKRLEALAQGHLVVRAGSHEFIIVCNNSPSVVELENLARNILWSFESPLMISDDSYYINLKIGVAVPNGGDSFKTLLKDAEIALHNINQVGVKGFCVINDFIRKNVDSLIHIGHELRCAVERNEFFLHFQPIVKSGNNNLIGAEALIRWNHPERGVINPLYFIPLAEDTGAIAEIGDFVLHEAISQLAKWLPYNNNFYISINVSAHQFFHGGLVERIQSLIRRCGVSPSHIVIEVTESVFISDVSHMTSILNLLRSTGIRVSLDDFGTGYSSLSYLQKIPLDNLKIDRNFLLDVHTNTTSASILKSIISLGQNLNLSITAEGVETEAQLSLLEQYGCDSFQGYYFSKPVPPERIREFIVSGCL